MAGTLHIFRRTTEPDSHCFQLNYTTAANSYARIFDNDEDLSEFLHEPVGLDDDEIPGVLEVLHRDGRATLMDVEIPEKEAAMVGLQQMPTDI